MLVFPIVLFSFNFFRFIQNRECLGVHGYVCCDGYSLDQTTGQCKKCPPGYYLKNCSKQCSTPYYGDECQSVCQCPDVYCHFAEGCSQHVNFYNSYQPQVTTKEVTAQQKTFSSTKSTSNLTVSYWTEALAFSSDLKDDVAQTTHLPSEMVWSKNDLFNHLVKFLGSFLGLCILVLIILVINYIYLKFFWKTRNDDDINEHHREQIIDL